MLTTLAIAMVVGALALSPATAVAATSGPNDAGTGTASGAGTTWATPENVAGAGSATVLLGAQASSNNLFGANYGFSIPASCVVDGIGVTVSRSCLGLVLPPFTRDEVLQLTKSGGVLVGSNHADTGTDWPILGGTASYGGAADKWGTTWTPQEINASSFGVSLQARNANGLLPGTASVDYIQVTVTYHDETAPATATVLVPQDGSWYSTTTMEPVFSGEAADNPGGRGLGADSTTFTLRNPNNQYWNGLAWQGGLFNLATTHSATTSGTVVTWDDAVPLPDWTIESTGTYTLQATAHDLDSNDTTGAATTFFISRAFDITASPSVNGTITPPGVTAVFEFQDETYTVEPDPGYHVDTVTVDGNPASLTDGKYVFTSVTAPHTIAATFVNTWDITAAPSVNGTITPPGTTPTLAGTDATYTVTPDPHYHVDTVTVDGNPVSLTDGKYVFSSVAASHTIEATFALNTWGITADPSVNGTITPPGTTVFDEGVDATYTVTADPGYHVDTVTVDGNPVSLTNGEYVFSSVAASHTIAATFAHNTWGITADPSVNGTITPPGTTVVDEGADATYTVTPDPGFAVDTVTVDGNPVTLIDGKYYVFSSVTASHTIAATFGAGWAITADPSANGTITPSGVTGVLNGHDATYTVTPNAGYHIEAVTVDGDPVTLNAENQYVFANVTADHLIAATFAPDVYIQVWRFRSNGMIGSYLWTRDAGERDSIIANLPTIWTFEGRAFLINASNPANHDMMFRFRNKRDWTYFYTADPAEKANLENNLSETWQFEGPTWNVARTTPTLKPVWRFRCLHNSTHLWTSDPAEKDTIVNTLQADYELEGIAYWLGE